MENNKQEVKQYEYAHLVMHCSKCNSKYVMEKDVKGGIQVNMPTVSNAELVLVCKECKNTVALYFVESDGASKKDKEQSQVNINVEDNNGIIANDSEINIDNSEITEIDADDEIVTPKMEIVE